MKASKPSSAILKGQITPEMSFDQKVWAVTMRVPRGKVATYGQVAQALKTKAYRAVGAALGRNPYAPQVPCHRIVGSNLTLTGYAGGLSKKQLLLSQEGIEIKSGKVGREFVVSQL